MEIPAKIFRTQSGRFQSGLDKPSGKNLPRPDGTEQNLGESKDEMAEASPVRTTLRQGNGGANLTQDLLTALQVEMRGTEDHPWENGQKSLKIKQTAQIRVELQKKQ